MLEDVRGFARAYLAGEASMVERLTRTGYIAEVRKYAMAKHGNEPDVVMHAERAARYLWERRGRVRH